MRTNAQRKDKVKIGNEEAEDVEEFVCPGATVTKDGGGLPNLRRIWKTQSIG